MFVTIYPSIFCINESVDAVAKVFGKSGLEIPAQYFDLTQQLVTNITKANIAQLQDAAQLIANQLESELAQVQTRINTLDSQKTRVPEELFFRRYILERRIEHFKRYFSLQEQTIGQWLGLYMQIVYHRLRTNFGMAAKELTLAHIIAQQMQQYFSFEDTLLLDYDHLLYFLSLVKKYKLPHFMLVWDSADEIEHLKKRAKQIKPQAQVQFIETIISFAVQGVLMAGGGSAMQIEDEHDRNLYEAARKRQTKIESDWQQFQKKVVEDQKNIMTAITTAFTTSSQAIQDRYAKDQQRLTAESIYLAQTINLATPPDQFLSGQIMWDQLFARSKMVTPNPSLPWYNIYNSSQLGSDWGYNVNTNSFWQYGYASYPSTLYWSDPTNKDLTISSNDPASFSIFTEFAIAKSSYDIEVDCTLSTSNYPFFAGIIFNRGRWISGTPERIWQYRLVGLYGQETTPGNTQTRTIDLVFAQPVIPTPDQKKSGAAIISPLEAISTKPESRLYRLSDAERIELDRNTGKFTFKITTAPKSAFINFSKTTFETQGKPTTKSVFGRAVTNLNDFDFLFHGIGFIAIGCQAEFKIKQPTQLVYRPEDIEQYEKQIVAKR